MVSTALCLLTPLSLSLWSCWLCCGGRVCPFVRTETVPGSVRPRRSRRAAARCQMAKCRVFRQHGYPLPPPGTQAQRSVGACLCRCFSWTVDETSHTILCRSCRSCAPSNARAVPIWSSLTPAPRLGRVWHSATVGSELLGVHFDRRQCSRHCRCCNPVKMRPYVTARWQQVPRPGSCRRCTRHPRLACCPRLARSREAQSHRGAKGNYHPAPPPA